MSHTIRGEFLIDVHRSNGKPQRRVCLMHTTGGELNDEVNTGSEQDRARFIELAAKRFRVSADALAWLHHDLQNENGVEKKESALSTEVICVGDVEPETVEWLWPGRVPIGKTTLLAGDPGLGKSMVTLAVTSAVTRGAPWPDSPHVSQPVGSVVLLTAEDDVADTVRPRLDAAGADCSKVFVLTSIRGSDDDGPYHRAFDLSRDIDRLREVINRTPDVRMLVIDPISAYMGRSDSHKNAEVRAVLAPLAELAAEKRVAVIAVTHLRKGEGPAMYRAMGSLAFVAAARAVWAVCRDPKEPDRRLVLNVKNNLAADTANGLAYRIQEYSGSPVVCWEADPVTVTAEEAMGPDSRKRGRPADDCDEAAAWLRKILAEGPRLAKDVIGEAAEAECISKRTLDRARKDIGVVAYRPENPGPWWWRLPGKAHCHNSAQEPPSPELWHSGNVPSNPRNSAGSEEQVATLPECRDTEIKAALPGLSPANTEGTTWL